MLSEAQISELEKVAALNGGQCDRCHRPIKIYKYSVNRQMLLVLKAMRAEVDKTNLNKVALSKLSLPYPLRSQATKMRLHGLIAKYKENGQHVADTWLITNKGGDFLRGKSISKTVVAFNNQVLGHEGALVDRRRLDTEPDYRQEPVTTPEAKIYSQARKTRKHLKVKAVYRGTTAELIRGNHYDLTLEQLEVGKPVKMKKPHERVYNDIKQFYDHWRIVE